MKRIPTFALIAMAVLALALLAGCGNNDAEQAEQAVPEAEATEVVATHDCEGGCGMTAVAEADLTEIDGKWYCTGCAEKVTKDKEDHPHG